ncbi:MAG: hypothetical protein K9I59_08995 [Chlorobium sp.]|uniref:hypothetical protein n=1 Tax=Chlorobium sp. TaxID=1095 RepID=UPI0025B97472|nr:hypothetical protein [Chlorobium sp.]MCF8216956.1 hypothetical protein [Chlorobium sp.]MCF8271785.1 hypothetical protein [Chlorobium sp.]MCF8288173.1 hypothetical protein [Chlorobium sp.]MCF8291779.1 hypothetical protein [Chlorobium sp.]MCF8385871.1 hypothetical protein [Chlorobium sp.]
MDHLQSDRGLDVVVRRFFAVSVTIISTAAILGALGAFTGNHLLHRLHPYIFFIGFGNLAILLLNRYLTAAIYPELVVNPQKQMRYIVSVLGAVASITVAVLFELPLLKAATGLFLMMLVAGPLIEIFTTLSIKNIWKEVSVRYYIFDVLFLMNANLGLFTLGLKEAFPDTGIIPFFVTQSAYFLGSSFPLSISVMGFLYTYAWRRSSKRELMKTLFSLWFYIFVGGVLIFLIVILIGHYFGMMLISHILLFGVMAMLGGFSLYLYNFFKTNFRHPALAFLLTGLALLFATSAFGIMNIYYIKGIPFGSHPPIRIDKMWIYHSHTHAALLGWITFSFIGMIYIVVPAIVRSVSLEKLRSESALTALLAPETMKKAFRQLTVLLLSATAVMLAFFLDNDILLGSSGIVFGLGVAYLLKNLPPELYRETLTDLERHAK